MKKCEEWKGSGFHMNWRDLRILRPENVHSFRGRYTMNIVKLKLQSLSLA